MKPTAQSETISCGYVLKAEDGAYMRVTCTMEKENACHVPWLSSNSTTPMSFPSGKQDQTGLEEGKEMDNLVRRHTMSTYRRCAFTGYRPQKLSFGFNESDPACVSLKAALRQRIEDLIGHGYAHFLSGGAMATDYGKSIVMRSDQ